MLSLILTFNLMETIMKMATGMYTMTLVEMMLDLMQQEIFLETLALALCSFLFI
jgi:hypothetical protein